ncbi:MAG: glycosyltransferase family 2 protein [Nitrospiraceae bacterium]|nr:MAG: glycosyltransferase family 2 protein [Nitrospiraceae bacterium]
MKLSIISSAFNEAEVLPHFLSRSENICNLLVQEGPVTNYEIVIVDDGSTDDTWKILQENHTRNSLIKGLKFSRNFGQHSSILAGLDHADGDFVVFLDPDLQAQPEDIPKLLQESFRGYDMVWGVARERRDNLLVKGGSKLFYWMFNKIAGVKVPREPVIACASRRAVNYITKLREARQFSLAQWVYVGFKTSYVMVDKKERIKGKMKYSLLRRANLAVVGIVGFSKLPLKISNFLGFIMSFVGLALGCYMIGRKLLLGIAVPGYASIIASIMFFFGLQFLILGIMGEYIGIIIDEVKGRPVYILEEILK